MLLPNQTGSIEFTSIIQANSYIPIKNKVIANTPGDKYLANNLAEFTIYPVGRDFSTSGTSIGDRVRSDSNFNGIQNSGEQGIKNVKVQLVSCTGDKLFDTAYSNNE
jgi:hypothetical protein